MLEQSADVPARLVGQTRVALGRIKEIVPTPLQPLVEVHAGTGLTEEGLGHEGDRHPVFQRGHPRHVLDDHAGVGGVGGRQQRGLDLALAGSADFVVVVLDGDPGSIEPPADSRPQIVEVVARRNGVVTAVCRGRVAASDFPAGPAALVRLDSIRGCVHAVFVGDAVEDVELELRPPQAGVGDPALGEPHLGTLDDAPRVVGIELAGVGLQRRADETQGRQLPEGVGKGRREIRDHDHVARTDALETDRRTVESDPVGHQFVAEARRRDRHVVPAPPQIAELEVDLLDALVRDVSFSCFYTLEHLASLDCPPQHPVACREPSCYQIHKQPPPRVMPGFRTGWLPALRFSAAIETPGPMGGHCLDLRQQATIAYPILAAWCAPAMYPAIPENPRPVDFHGAGALPSPPLFSPPPLSPPPIEKHSLQRATIPHLKDLDNIEIRAYALLVI